MRLQLALNVPHLDQAIDFYSKLFATAPAKVREGYANWAIDDPPLKLVIFENTGQPPGSINHLGVEVRSAAEVVTAQRRLAATGLETSSIDETVCCHAEKVETWVGGDPGGHGWEIYAKQGDVDDQLENVVLRSRAGAAADSAAGRCCG